MCCRDGSELKSTGCSSQGSCPVLSIHMMAHNCQNIHPYKYKIKRRVQLHWQKFCRSAIQNALCTGPRLSGNPQHLLSPLWPTAGSGFQVLYGGHAGRCPACSPRLSQGLTVFSETGFCCTSQQVVVEAGPWVGARLGRSPYLGRRCAKGQGIPSCWLRPHAVPTPGAQSAQKSGACLLQARLSKVLAGFST